MVRHSMESKAALMACALFCDSTLERVDGDPRNFCLLSWRDGQRVAEYTSNLAAEDRTESGSGVARNGAPTAGSMSRRVIHIFYPVTGNVDVRVVDCESDHASLDGLLRPLLDGADFEHVLVNWNGTRADMFVGEDFVVA